MRATVRPVVKASYVDGSDWVEIGSGCIGW
jgi:hypothetical protein